MKFKNFLILIILLITFSFLLEILVKQKVPGPVQRKTFTSSCGQYDQRIILIAKSIIKVDVADNDCKRVLGLSDRVGLGNNEGMLFVFDKIGYHAFWMKDMKFPIDILWISDDFLITGIESGVATSTFPTAFGQNYLAKYVLELPSGYSLQNNIKVGDKIIYL